MFCVLELIIASRRPENRNLGRFCAKFGCFWKYFIVVGFDMPEKLLFLTPKMNFKIGLGNFLRIMPRTVLCVRMNFVVQTASSC